MRTKTRTVGIPEGRVTTTANLDGIEIEVDVGHRDEFHDFSAIRSGAEREQYSQNNYLLGYVDVPDTEWDYIWDGYRDAVVDAPNCDVLEEGVVIVSEFSGGGGRAKYQHLRDIETVAEEAIMDALNQI